MADIKTIKTIKTSRGELRYYRDWEETEGSIVMLNPQTIERYKAIKEIHPDADSIGVFFAFSQKQFDENRQKLIDLGTLAPDAQIKYHPHISGLYGTDESIGKYLAAYDERAKQIPKECDPQEVYFYEWNNHETMYSWDGDDEAIKIILEYFGMEAAMSITRIDACDLNKLIERDHPYIFRPQSEPTV